jgi:hypothetical protein
VFPRDQVLNHVLLDVGALTPRRPCEGWLLATGRPMPDSLRATQRLDATLAILASNHLEHTAQICLWTERLEVDKKRATRTPDLYREPLGFEVGSPVVVCNQHGAAHTEKSRSLHADGDERI